MAGSKAGAIFSWASFAIILSTVTAIAVILATLASALPSNQWWMRIWDFPRLAIFTIGLMVFLALCFLRFRWRWGR